MSASVLGSSIIIIAVNSPLFVDEHLRVVFQSLVEEYYTG